MEILLSSIGQIGLSTLLYDGSDIATADQYSISTIYRPDIACYQTCILELPNFKVLYRIERKTMEDAISEHIDTIHMAKTKPMSDWDNSKPYQNELLYRSMIEGPPLSDYYKSDSNPKRLFWAKSQNINKLRLSGINVIMRPDAFLSKWTYIKYGLTEAIIASLFYYFHGHGFIYYITMSIFIYFAYSALQSFKNLFFGDLEGLTERSLPKAPVVGKA